MTPRRESSTSSSSGGESNAFESKPDIKPDFSLSGALSGEKRGRSRSAERQRQRDSLRRDRDDRHRDEKRRRRHSPERRRRSRSPDRERRRHRSRSGERRRRHRSPRDEKIDMKDIKKEGENEENRDRRRYGLYKKKRRNDDEKKEYQWGKPNDNVENEEEEEPVEKEKPNFALSGALAEETNKVQGVVLKHTEPEDAAKPKLVWMWYVFSGDEFKEKMHLHRQSSYLIGRHPKICDIPMLHPSISTQHAVLQYRRVKGKVRPYIMDLGSSNGTTLNGERIEPQRYYELFEKDMCKFGYSTRDYVLMNERSLANAEKEDEGDSE